MMIALTIKREILANWNPQFNLEYFSWNIAIYLTYFNQSILVAFED